MASAARPGHHCSSIPGQLVGTTALLAICGISQTALAQQTPSDLSSVDSGAGPVRTPVTRPTRRGNVIEQVVVTASRRRSENVQRTPIAITAITASALAERHVTNFQQIGDLAPNLQVEHSVGSAGVADIYLRGFDQNSNDLAVDPHVAVFIDGIYQPSPVGTLVDLFDVSQVEVDAGPQGTLAGKNAPIGAIYISTAQPTKKLTGMLETDCGSYDAYGVRGNISGPLWTNGDRKILAARVSVVDQGGGNWEYDLFNHKRDFGGNRGQTYRVALAFTPTDELSWNIAASVQKNNGEQAGAYNAGVLGGHAGTPQSALQITPVHVCCWGLPPARNSPMASLTKVTPNGPSTTRRSYPPR